MSKVCEEFEAKDGALFGHEFSHQPGGPCRFYVHPGGCDNDHRVIHGIICKTDGFKATLRMDQGSDGEID